MKYSAGDFFSAGKLRFLVVSMVSERVTEELKN